MNTHGRRLSEVLQAVSQSIASAAREAAQSGGAANRVGRSNVVVARNIQESGSIDIETSRDVSSISQATTRGTRQPKQPKKSQEGS